MNMNDDTQKEMIIIPSFRGVEDVSVGKFSCFELLGLEVSILGSQGIESCCFSSKGIDPCL